MSRCFSQTVRAWVDFNIKVNQICRFHLTNMLKLLILEAMVILLIDTKELTISQSQHSKVERNLWLDAVILSLWVVLNRPQISAPLRCFSHQVTSIHLLVAVFQNLHSNLLTQASFSWLQNTHKLQLFNKMLQIEMLCHHVIL